MSVKKRQYSSQFIEAFKALSHDFTQLMELKPWEIIADSIILAVKHPVSDEIYYAYFMGELGEIVGFNLYRGANLAPWLLELANISEGPSPSEMLLHTFCQLTAVKKTELDIDAKELHAAAGITVPRGKSGYLDALFFSPGFTPVLITESQVREIAPLLQGFTYLLKGIAADALEKAEDLDDDGMCYIAVQQTNGSWQAETQQLPEPGYVDVLSVAPIDKKAWASVKMLPKSREPFLLHAQLFPIPVADEQGRGTYPLMLLCVGAESELIHGFNIIPVGQWKNGATTALAQMFKERKMLPAAIHIADERLVQIAREVAQELRLEVFEDGEAKEFLADVMDELMENMGR